MLSPAKWEYIRQKFYQFAFENADATKRGSDAGVCRDMKMWIFNSLLVLLIPPSLLVAPMADTVVLFGTQKMSTGRQSKFGKNSQNGIVRATSFLQLRRK